MKTVETPASAASYRKAEPWSCLHRKFDAARIGQRNGMEEGEMKEPLRMRAATEGLVLFGAGGPLVADVEETIARRGLDLRALIRNRPGPCLVLDAGKLVDVADFQGPFDGIGFLCPLFTPANRRVAANEALSIGLRPAVALVDPTAIVAASASFGPGTYVNAGCIVGAATQVGRFAIVNRATSIGHHGWVGDFASVGPGVVCAGQVTIKAAALIGAGAVVMPGITIGERAVVAPGTIVVRDVPDDNLAAGNPMRLRGRSGEGRRGQLLSPGMGANQGLSTDGG